ncbi:hypothetical protein MKX03_009842 [Papaver bracteatum]|nr:hypothetical protein MKX03_009842 [Papaver bracteatum]
MASSSSSRPKQAYDLDITVISAKHLKNVNWRHGDLKPYVIFWLDPDRRICTQPDDSGSTRPVWNETFTLSVNQSLHDSLLTLEIFHSKPSETPKPLVGTLRFPLKDLVDSESEFSNSVTSVIKTLELRRPSGRPQGKIRIKLSLRARPLPPPPPPPQQPQPQPDYHITPPSSYYYSSAPPPPLPRDYTREYSPSPYTVSPIPQPAPTPPPPAPYTYGGVGVGGSTVDPYRYYYTGYHPPPPLPPRPFFDRTASYGGPPSAPVDYSSAPLYDQKQRGGGIKMGSGTGLAVGAVAGVLGGLALEEGLKYEEEKIANRVENDIASRDDYSDYRSDY